MNAYPQVPGPDAHSEPALAALLETLQARHHGSIAAVLIYGSCLRSGDIHDGLLDLYLLCDDYRSAYGNSWLALANRLLPPNVFYAEHTRDGETLVSVERIADTDDEDGDSADHSAEINRSR